MPCWKLASSFELNSATRCHRASSQKIKMAHNWACQQFSCLSMTLEQPFKDTANSPCADGWNPGRVRLFGHAQLSALSKVIDKLR